MNTPIKIHEHNKINHKHCIHSIRRRSYYFISSINFGVASIQEQWLFESSIYFTSQSITDVEESEVP